jgi:D-hexose-6-phosphate mutarotase
VLQALRLSWHWHWHQEKLWLTLTLPGWLPARRFKATYAVTLHNEQLQTSFRVQNLDDKPFDFTAALHTYIEVSGRAGMNTRTPTTAQRQ